MPDLILKNLRMNSRKFAMNYGAVLGLCLVAIAAVMWSFGIDKNGSLVPSILNNGLIIAGIVYTIIQFRDTENSGVISYGDSLKLGTSVAFFSSVILAFYTFIFINYIEPNTLNEILVQAEQAILESNPEISDEELDLALDITTKFVQPHWMLILGVLGGTFMGFIYSLVISIFTKKENLFEFEEEIETKEEAIAVKIDEEQFEELKDSMKSEENEQDD